jgi:transposase
MLLMQPGLPERRTHDYRRHGTTTLFAALEIATGKVTAATRPRHRHREFLRFLKQVAKAYPDRELHLVMDNYAAHKRVEVRRWLEANPRVHVHFTPPRRPGSTSSRSGSASSNAKPSTAAPSAR